MTDINHFKNYESVTLDVKNQIQNVVDVWKSILKEALIGIYLHGSIVLDCFVEGVSDIDLLMVCREKINRKERITIAKEMIQLDGNPSAIEMSAILDKHLVPWQYPTKCQFHYSEYWTERYKEMLHGSKADNFIIEEDFTDTDIAAYIHLINQKGICLYGEPIKKVFPSIPVGDFWNSLSVDIDDYDFQAYGRKYYASQIITLGRIWSYKVERRILNKYEAGIWLLERIPEHLRYIVDNAIKSRYFGEERLVYQPDDLNCLKDFLILEIKR